MTASIGWSGDHEVLDFLDDAGKRLGRHSPVTATGSSPELWSATLISQRQKRLPDAIAAAFLPASWLAYHLQSQFQRLSKHQVFAGGGDSVLVNHVPRASTVLDCFYRVATDVTTRSAPRGTE